MPGLDDEELRALIEGEERAADLDLAPLDAPSEEVDEDELLSLLSDALASSPKPGPAGQRTLEHRVRPSDIQAPPGFDPSTMNDLVDRTPEGTPPVPATPVSAQYQPAGELTGLEALTEQPATITQSRPVLAGQPPAPKDAASYVMDESTGKQRIYGVDDQRQDLTGNAARVGELYKPEAPRTGPGAREQAYLASEARPGQKELNRAWMVQSLFGAPGDNFKAVELVRARQNDYDQGLARARAEDQSTPADGGPLVDRATAEALVLFGLTPEAATQTRVGSPVMKLMQSGGLNVAKGLRGQDTQVHLKSVDETGQTWRNDSDNATDLVQTDKNNAAKIEAAKIRKRGGAGHGAGLQPDVHAAYLAQQANVPLEVAQAYVAGTLEAGAVDARTLEGMQVASTLFKNADPKRRAQMIQTRMGAEGGNADAAGRAADVKRGDPAYRLKVKREMAEVGTPLRNAIVGYNSLSPKAKQLVSQVGLSGNMGMLRDAGLSDKEQAAIGAVVEQINASVKALSGAAVSASEWSRVGAAMGISGEGYNPWKSAGALGAWLQRGKQAFDAQRAAIESEFPGLLSGGQ